MPAPPFEEDLPLHHTSTPFFNFSDCPPLGEVIKIYSNLCYYYIENLKNFGEHAYGKL